MSYATADPDGERLVCKVFVRGSQSDAEREVALGRLAAGLDVVQYLRAGIDGATNRPCAIMRLHDGTDLDSLVGEAGALEAPRAVALLLPVAVTLARLHALRCPMAPRGICHGDVKPKNLLATATTTLLLDFEHSRPLGEPGPGEGFTGGTHGFAPPEAEQGAPPDAACDVFGLGATLRWLCTGGVGARLPLDPGVEQFVLACTAADPRGRPSAAAAAERLAGLAARLRDDPAETVIAPAAAGDPGAAQAALLRLAGHPCAPALRRLAERGARVLRALPQPLTMPPAVPAEPGPLQRELVAAARLLRHFPRHPELLRWRRLLAAAAGRLLAGARGHANSLRRAEEFEAAAVFLQGCARLAAVALAAPGGCPIPPPEHLHGVSLLHRSPLAFLRELAADVAAAREDLERAAVDVTAAERRLDLAAAELAIDAMAATYGGSAPTVVRRRDQLHRLTFYLQRVARAAPNVERLLQTWPGPELEPLQQFVAASAGATRGPGRHEHAAGPVGLRSLLVTFVNLAEEFPYLAATVTLAIDALGGALERATDQCRELLGDAQQKLHAVPVPVRPLQVALARLDTFRLLEAFVDRPGAPRSQLLDGIETLRLALEQARATRDRLAHGAEQAILRGHWTTGLFEMERAVAGMKEGDDSDREEAERLRGRLAEARRQKQELEAALRRNVDLAARYATLQDDATSSFPARLQVLAERRDCLHFLSVHLPAERGQLYARDLREVETQSALEQAGLAETELDGTEDPFARLRLARTTLDRLGNTFTSTDLGSELPGRILRLLEHWRTLTAQCQRVVERVHAERQLRQRQRLRLGGVAAAAVLVVAVAAVLAMRPWPFGEALAAARAAAPGAVAALAEPTALEHLGDRARQLG
ncbi:MAG: hypothetical protein FJ265_20745, partial [Planctomycetes bacterium]|nr:hypothetical protein [Planctomycetota bacterium]